VRAGAPGLREKGRTCVKQAGRPNGIAVTVYAPAMTRRRASEHAPRAVAMLAAVLVAALAGCASGATPNATASMPMETGASDEALLERLDAIGEAVAAWRSADDLATASRAAEGARNLVVGPAGPYYGDGDGDGTVEGASAVGLLPGLHGEVGLATTDHGACVVRDVLGGDWSDAAERWAILERAIDDWAPTNNTFPALPSHPQRLIGWATLTLAATDLASAREYGGHAQLHLDVSRRAIDACDA